MRCSVDSQCPRAGVVRWQLSLDRNTGDAHHEPSAVTNSHFPMFNPKGGCHNACKVYRHRRSVRVVLLSTVVVLAGGLDPANPPASTSSNTLEDIYARLDTGAAPAPSTWSEPSAGPGSTGHTLQEVMDIAPAVDASAAAPARCWPAEFSEALAAATGGRKQARPPRAATSMAGTASRPLAFPMAFTRAIGHGQRHRPGGRATSRLRSRPLWRKWSLLRRCPTGQTTRYDTGDDGDLEKGVAWPSPRFTDHGDGTVDRQPDWLDLAQEGRLSECHQDLGCCSG